MQMHNPVDLVLGSPFYRHKLLSPLLIRQRHVPLDWQWTAAFNDYVDNIDDKRVLLDHIAVSPRIASTVVRAGIAHDIHQSCYSREPLDDNTRGGRTSDHIPIFVDLH